MIGVTRRLGCIPLIGQQVALGAFLVLRHELLAHTRRAVISAGRTVPSGGQGMRILSGAMCPGSIQHLGVTLASEIARWDLCGFCASANTAWVPVSSHRADVDGSHQAYLIVNLSRQRHIQLCIDRVSMSSYQAPVFLVRCNFIDRIRGQQRSPMPQPRRWKLLTGHFNLLSESTLRDIAKLPGIPLSRDASLTWTASP